MSVETDADVWIDASVESVFGFMDEPTNQAAVTPSLRTADRIERLENGGNRARYVYEMFGVTFTGEVAASIYEPDRRIVYEMTGDLEGTITFEFESADGGTGLTYAATYEIPGPLPEWLVAPVVRWYNDREVETLLATVKERLEQGPGERIPDAVSD